MNLDIDRIVDAVQPWDFQVTLGGVTYPTRRPGVGELAAFGRHAADPAAMAGVLDGLFAGDVRPPPVGTWTVAQMTALIAGYSEYFSRFDDAGKSSADAATAAAAAVRAAMAPADPGT